MGHRASTTVNPPKQRPEPERSEDLISALALVPSYSVLFRDTQAALFSESGPLPIPTRHFIALMVRLITRRILIFVYVSHGPALCIVLSVVLNITCDALSYSALL